MIQRAGYISALIGAMAGDSDCIWVPVAFIMLGLALITIGRR